MDKTRETMLKLGALVGVELEGGEKFGLDKDAPCEYGQDGMLEKCIECRSCWGVHGIWDCPVPTYSGKLQRQCGKRDKGCVHRV